MEASSGKVDIVEEINKKNAPEGRRCGVSRRSFTYAHHIPERRKGEDRRRSEDCDLELVDQTIPDADNESIAEKPPMPKD